MNEFFILLSGLNEALVWANSNYNQASKRVDIFIKKFAEPLDNCYNNLTEEEKKEIDSKI